MGGGECAALRLQEVMATGFPCPPPPSLPPPVGDFHPSIWLLINFRRCLRRTGGGLDMAAPANQASVPSLRAVTE